ncbi:fimbrial protein [Paraburkholderia sp. C35]|uniref:fimbrial protein n=1 Tax=Paraburkholderia sp. C35 TaxID=2126993 RepID=UPI0013A59915|nr:fimbrial protein [Paraburkholderia sp. C35]
MATRSLSGGEMVSGSPYTVATNVPGIGMRFGSAYTGYVDYWGAGNQESFAGAWAWNGTRLGAQVVVTGPVRSGTVNGLATGTFTLGGTLVIANLRTTTFDVTSTACSVTTPSVSVNMPTVNSSVFASVGTTAAPQPFAIRLSCAPDTRVFITLSDSSNPANTSSVLTLTPASSAKGIGLQITSDSKPVSFGPDSPVAGNVNQWQAGTSSGGEMTIPLAVQYIQTAPAISAGSVTGLATFTMSYQ